MDSGSYPLNHTIPPFASGDPMNCPPTFTWYVVAARALDAEKTKTKRDRIETIARIFGVSRFDFLTLSHMTRGIGHFVFNAQRDRPGPWLRAGGRSEQRPYGLPQFILTATVPPSRTVSKGTRTLPRPSDSMPRIRQQEGG